MSQTCQNKLETSDFVTKTPFPCLPLSWYKKRGILAEGEKDGNVEMTEFESIIEIEKDNNNKDTEFYSTAEKENGNSKETEFYSTAEKENGNSKQTEFYSTAEKENGNSKETEFYSTAGKENGNNKETEFYSTAEKENGNNKETESYSTAEKENGNSKQTEFYSTAEKENGNNKETEFYSIAENENSNNEPNIVSCSNTDRNVDREFCSINQGPFPLLSRTWYGIVGRTAMHKKKDLQNINEGRNSFARETWLPLTILHYCNIQNNHPKQFPLMKKEWYKRRGKLATKNIARENENIHRVQTFSENSRIGMEFSFCAGTLMENLRAKLVLKYKNKKS